MSTRYPQPDWCGSLTILTPNHEDHATILIPCGVEFALGRDSNRCDYVFDNSLTFISALHCIIRASLSSDRRTYEVTVEDRSLNGTYIDNIRLLGRFPQQIHHEGILHFGGCPSVDFALALALFKPSSFQSQFDLGKKLGEGGFGQVYAATSRRTGCEYAVKRMHNRHAPETTNAIVREIQNLKEMKHDRIIRLYGYKVDCEFIHVIMELALGSVADIMETGATIREADARAITYSVCLALKHLHGNHRIVHRDVKPDNVLIVTLAPLVIKLADFGFSKALTGGTISQTVCGTPMYMAPEVVMAGANGYRHYNQKADSFSVGVMLFVMLAGQFPFEEHHINISSLESRFDYRTVKWERLPGYVSMNARTIMTQLMRREVAFRLAATQALAHPWLMNTETEPPSNAENVEGSAVGVVAWMSARLGQAI